MNHSRRSLLKLIAPIAAASTAVAGFGYLKLRGDTRIIKKGDLNKYTSDGKFFIDGKIKNTPGESGWLEVSASDDKVMQKFFNFNNPEHILIRSHHGYWSEWKPVGHKVSGSNIVCLGDSITGSFNWPAKMQRIIGGNVINCGISGTTASEVPGDFGALSLSSISKAIYDNDWTRLKEVAIRIYDSELKQDYTKVIESLESMKWESVGTLIVFYGTNDFGFGSPVGDDVDLNESTFVGAINSSVGRILTKYPNINIKFISPLWRSAPPKNISPDNGKNEKGMMLVDYVDALVKCAGFNGIPCLDLYRNSGINRFNGAHMLADGLHPTAAGEDRIAEKISAII